MLMAHKTWVLGYRKLVLHHTVFFCFGTLNQLFVIHFLAFGIKMQDYRFGIDHWATFQVNRVPDLPTFFGKPEVWPVFISRFEHSTVTLQRIDDSRYALQHRQT